MTRIRALSRIDTRVREVRLRKGTAEYAIYRAECSLELMVWRRQQWHKGLCNSCMCARTPGYATCKTHRAYYRLAKRKERLCRKR